MPKPNLNIRQTDGGGQGTWWNPPPPPKKKIAPLPKPKPKPSQGFGDFPYERGEDKITPWMDETKNKVQNWWTWAKEYGFNARGSQGYGITNPVEPGDYVSYKDYVASNNFPYIPLPPSAGIPKNWDISPIAGATRANIPYNPQQEYYAYSPERDAGLINSEIAWAKQNRAKNTPQDYFDRIVINGRTYSVPNQMLNFAEDYPWETTSWWYEPPAGDLITNNKWKEWRTDEGVNSDDSTPVDDAGDWGGGGYGWSGGYGSSNYSSKPAYPTQGYKQDPNIYYQQLVKWVI